MLLFSMGSTTNTIRAAKRGDDLAGEKDEIPDGEVVQLRPVGVELRIVGEVCTLSLSHAQSAATTQGEAPRVNRGYGFHRVGHCHTEILRRANDVW
jgi:hypothetical protein